MNGGGNREDGCQKLEIEEATDKNYERKSPPLVLMWGYLPGISQQRSPLFSPSPVRFPYAGDSWKDVSGGGCGFALAISGNSSLFLKLFCICDEVKYIGSLLVCINFYMVDSENSELFPLLLSLILFS